MKSDIVFSENIIACGWRPWRNTVHIKSLGYVKSKYQISMLNDDISHAQRLGKHTTPLTSSYDLSTQTYDQEFRLPHTWENPLNEDREHYGIEPLIILLTKKAESTHIHTYFKIICNTLTEMFGKEEVKNQGPHKILRVVELFDENFEEFIKYDSWGLKGNSIIPPEELDYLQQECVQDKSDNKREERFQVLKREVLRNLLEYYKTVATVGNQVDAITQAFVGIIWTKFDIRNRKFESHCYLPHRTNLVKTYTYCNGWIKLSNVTPNPHAVILGCQAFFIQIAVPVLLFYYTNWRHADNYDYLDQGEVISNLCPEPFTKFAARGPHQNAYNIGTKLTSVIFISHLYAILKKDSAEDWKNFKINWQNHALPKLGLIFGRVKDSAVFGLILLTTVTLFFQDPGYADLALNVLGMQFIMNFSEEMADTHSVQNGIGSTNDGGRKLLLSYIANGIRKPNHVEAILRLTNWFSGFMMTILIWTMYIWVFNCL
jgi:hypothetical protein